MGAPLIFVERNV